MKFKAKSVKVAALMMTCLLTLTACGSGGNGSKDSSKDSKATQTADEMLKKYPEVFDNEGTPVEGGVLKIGNVSDAQFKGVLSPQLAVDGVDMAMASPMRAAMPVNKDFTLKLDSDKTPLNLHIDKDKKTISIKINPKFKWSNGEVFTTDDIVKTIEIIANPEYIKASQSPRFSTKMRLIEGIEEYNQGKATKISGLEVKSPSEMVVHLKEIIPSVMWGGVIPYDYINAKQFADIPMDKIQSSDALRKNPLSYGPYVVKSIVPGEKIIYEANKHYYKGEPKVKTLELVIVPSSQQVAAMKSGKFDILWDPHNNVFDQMKELKNARPALSQSNQYGYLGFKTGKWDAANSKVIYDPNSKMADVALRQAIGYAMNVDQVAEKFSNGLSKRLNTPIPPVYEGLNDPNVEGYPLDLDKANKLLDEAGYKMGKDGFRTDKNGKPLVIHLAMMKGSSLTQPISENYRQQWKKIGLNVQLVNGRLLEMHDFYDRLEKDSPDIDMFIAGWICGSDPNPTGFYGPNEAFNMERYENPKLTKTLDAINSVESLDRATMIKNYKEFQKVFQELAVCIPTTNPYEYIMVNNRVKHYDGVTGSDWDLSQIELTSPEPLH